MNIKGLPIPSQHISQNSSCCQQPLQMPKWQKVVDTICRVAIAAFAAFCAPLPFLTFFGAGLITGTIYASIKIYQKKSMFPDGKSKPVCAQGYMDFLSGMRFPPLIGTLATTGFIAAHTRHDPLFYTPFCGLFIGFWLGRDSVRCGKDLSSYIFKTHVAP